MMDDAITMNGTPTKRLPGTKRWRGRRAAWLLANLLALPGARKLALLLGSIGCLLLVLSLAHCTTAVMFLTGSTFVPALVIAAAVDVGMVATEITVIISTSRQARGWATAYLVVAIGLSMILNAAAYRMQVPADYSYAAIGAGVLLPLLVFVLAQVAAQLWTEAA